MSNILCRTRHTLLAICLTLGASFATQAAYSNVYIFGDSLTDTGNVLIASGGSNPPAPYFDGRFSNGPVWVEHLADGLGYAQAARPSLNGGNNYSWAGAFSNQNGLAGPGTGLTSQVFGQWSGVADPNALYVVNAGGNDLRHVDELNNVTGSPYSDPATLLGNMLFSLNHLIDSGARHLLVSNVADLGLVPEAEGRRADATALTVAYNSALSAALEALSAARQVSIIELDVFGLLNDVISDTQNGGTKYGFLDASIPCFSPLSPFTCDDSVFSDTLHPTGRAHEILGAAALEIVKANQVPEPATLALVFAALIAAGARRRLA